MLLARGTVVVTDEVKNVLVDELSATITLGGLDVEVSGGGASWLYNKLLKVRVHNHRAHRYRLIQMIHVSPR
eukprot:SAG11_NODE_2401_length_3402_cov_17.587648_2_plen_72_part_00